MSRYSIKDLELLTGIKSHTLRMWENRYSIITPKRTKTNIRYYSDDDLKKLLNVAHLNKQGYKISKIANLDEPERNQLVLENSDDCRHIECQIQSLTKAMINFDEIGFNHLLSNAILKLGFKNCMTDIVFPFLRRIGQLWQACSISVAQEHFVSNIIRQKIIVATEGQILKNPENTKRILLFCPAGEQHELNLLFVNYILRSKNLNTLYLGTELPLCDLPQIKKKYDPDAFIMAITAGYVQKTQGLICEELQDKLPNTPGIIIGGQCKDCSQWPSKIFPVNSYEEFENMLEELI